MKLEDIKTIGVVGGGVMGGGITQAIIVNGINVIVRDLSDEILERMKNTIINGRFGLQGGVERGKHTQEEMDAALARLTVTTRVEDLADCDFVLETIGGPVAARIEDKGMKLKVYEELDRVVKKEAVFASNTSRFTIADLAAATGRSARFIGMHWFSPANIMKLVEIIYTAEVSEEVIELTKQLCQRFGKTYVMVKDVPGDTGFIGNRIMGIARQEAEKIVEEGVASPEDVNTAMMLGYNWPAGPLRLGGPSSRTGWE